MSPLLPFTWGAAYWESDDLPTAAAAATEGFIINVISIPNVRCMCARAGSIAGIIAQGRANERKTAPNIYMRERGGGFTRTHNREMRIQLTP